MKQPSIYGRDKELEELRQLAAEIESLVNSLRSLPRPGTVIYS